MQATYPNRYKVLIAIFVGAVIAVAVTPAVAGANTITPVCDPACDTWVNSDVTLQWTFDVTPDPPNPCPAPQPFTTEGDHMETCMAAWTSGDPLTRTQTVHIQIDKTSPTGVVGALARPPDSGPWFNHPVTVNFTGDGGLSGLAGCSHPNYGGPDSALAAINGTCTDRAGNVSAPASVSIAYDATPPTAAGAATRPPDFNGWYNHPVAFAFSGVDATSGIAACQSVTYSGPTDSTATVGGGCTDNAGNRGVTSVSFRYDSTRPTPANLTIKPRSRALRLSWPSIADANNFVVTRSEQGSSAAPTTVYSGTGHSVLDKGLQNGRKYRYTITNTDQAGNQSTQTVAAVPTASSLRPVVGARVTSAPLLTWKKVKRARYYNIQLFRGGHKVLSTWPTTNSFQVGRSWRFRKKKYTLTPGHYRWYVWPGIGKRSQNRYGRILGQSSFRLVAP